MTNQKEHNPNYGVTLQQVMELWIIPEIKKRQDEGTIPTEPPYTLHKAQVLIGADGTKIVRLNNEVKILAKAKTTKPITKGQVLYESDIETIEELLLIEEERDLGHFTFIKFKNSWILAFSFIYDTSKAIKLLKKGEEFLSSAKHNTTKGLWGASATNLYYAFENIVKARFYLFPNQEIRKSTKHGTLAGIVNKYYKNSDVINLSQKNTYNFLHSNINKARYDETFKMSTTQVNTMINDANALVNEINKYTHKSN